MKKIIIILFLITTGAYAQEKPAQGTANDPVQIQQGSRPVPDPTELTARAIVQLRTELTALWDEKFENLQKQITRIETGLDGRDEAVRREVDTLKILVDEKFKGVDIQFGGRDIALNAALSAAKSSVADQNASNSLAATKAEDSFNKRIEGISSSIVLQTKTTDDKISDLKDRITQIESASSGAGGAVNWVIAGIGVFATLIAIGTALFAMLKPTVPLPVVQYSEPTIHRRKA